jgi:hypothetical protein
MRFRLNDAILIEWLGRSLFATSSWPVSAQGHFRKSAREVTRSALPSIADVSGLALQVRLGPITDV